VSTEAGFPAVLSRDGNAAWRTPVRPGKSSPVLSRRHVFTVAFDEGQFYTQCFDRASGHLLWEQAEQRPRRLIQNWTVELEDTLPGARWRLLCAPPPHRGTQQFD
jgi:hypothetical protein